MLLIPTKGEVLKHFELMNSKAYYKNTKSVARGPSKKDRSRKLNITAAGTRCVGLQMVRRLQRPCRGVTGNPIRVEGAGEPDLIKPRHVFH